MNNLSVATNLLKPLETSSSLGMFARDTGGCLIARLGLARTKEEAKEIAFCEISESALFYFSAPALAKGCGNLFSKIFKINKKQIDTPLADIKNVGQDVLKNIKLAKFSQIMATFGVILPFIFGIAPVRNILTLKDSGKEKFIELIGLKNKKGIKNPEEIKAQNKAKKLIKKLSLISTVSIAAMLGIIGVSKNDKIYKKIEPVLSELIKTLEFSSEGDLKLAHYGALIYPVSILGYFKACRDKYEVMENARRFSITVPLLFFGEKLIQNPIYRHFDKVFKTNVMSQNGEIKSYKEILKMPADIQKQALKSKNLSYGLTFFINTLFIAGAVALLNRIETKRKYRQDSQNQLNTNLKPLNMDEYKKQTIASKV